MLYFVDCSRQEEILHKISMEDGVWICSKDIKLINKKGQCELLSHILIDRPKQIIFEENVSSGGTIKKENFVFEAQKVGLIINENGTIAYPTVKGRSKLSVAVSNALKDFYNNI